MIIGLSGYLKSGKDTAGQMIIDLTMIKNHKQILDEFDRPIPKLDGSGYWTENDIPLFEVRKFADTLKQVAGLMLGVPREKFEDQEYKDSKLGPEWDNISIREFLQRLGTKAVRHHVHENAWVNSAMAGYDDSKHWLFTDVRFPNEAQAIKDRGGVSIRLKRYPPGCSPVFMDRHESEVSLDDCDFDYVIYNVGTLDDLKLQVKEILSRINQVNLVGR